MKVPFFIIDCLCFFLNGGIVFDNIIFGNSIIFEEKQEEEQEREEVRKEERKEEREE